MSPKTNQELVTDLIQGFATHPDAFSNILGGATALSKDEYWTAFKAGVSTAYNLDSPTRSAAKKLYNQYGDTGFVEALLENGLLTELTKIPQEQAQAIINQLIAPLADTKHKHHKLIKNQLETSGYGSFTHKEIQNSFNLILAFSNHLVSDTQGLGFSAIEIFEETLAKRMKANSAIETFEELIAQDVLKELKIILDKKVSAIEEFKDILDKKITAAAAIKEFKEALDKKGKNDPALAEFQLVLNKKITNAVAIKKFEIILAKKMLPIEDTQAILANLKKDDGGIDAVINHKKEVIASCDLSLANTMINSLYGEKNNDKLTPLITEFVTTLKNHTELSTFHESLRK